MTILSHYDLETPINISPDFISVLVFEDPTKFYNYYTQLKEQTEGGEGGFSLYKKDKEVPFKSIKLVDNYYQLSYNDKKTQQVFLQEIKTLVDKELLVEYADLTQRIFSFWDKVNASIDFEMDYNAEGDITMLFKAFGISIKEEKETFLARLVNYVQVYARLVKVKFFIFVNLKCFLSNDELLTFYKECALEDVSLLLLENTVRDKLDTEVITVCDKDFCQFVV